jgi:CBS domain-containing protein
MRARDLCGPHVALADPGASVRDAALQMRNEHVGALVVVERRGGVERPVGILTDRDIVVAVIAVPEARPESIRVADAMSTDLALAREDDGLYEIVQRMSARAVRRLPVVGADGSLRGLVTLDDVLRVLGAELAQLAEGLRWSRTRERGARAAMPMPQ